MIGNVILSNLKPHDLRKCLKMLLIANQQALFIYPVLEYCI